MSTAMNKAGNVLSWVVALFGGAAVLIAIAIYFIGLNVVTVETGSMAPSIPAHSVVFTKNISIADAKPGDVLTIKQPNGGYITHRLVSATPNTKSTGYTVVTKGDANLTNDPLPLTVVRVNHVVAVLPGAGDIIHALASRFAGIGLGGLIVAGLFAGYRDFQKRNEATFVEFRDERRSTQTAAAPRIAAPKTPRPIVRPTPEQVAEGLTSRLVGEMMQRQTAEASA